MATISFLPTSEGSNTGLTKGGAVSTYFYEYVDDPIGSNNGTTDYLYNNTTTYATSTSNFTNSNMGGTITQIEVFGYFAGNAAGGDMYIKMAIDAPAQTVVVGSEQTHNNDTFTLFSQVWTTNPWTAAAWTWANLDDLEFGCSTKKGTVVSVRCTQYYLTVTYLPTGGSRGYITGLW
jgi:hypothetical protein